MMGLETLNNPYLGADTSLSCSAETSAKIDGEVLSIIKAAHDKALRILEENKEKLHSRQPSCWRKKPLPVLNSWKY